MQVSQSIAKDFPDLQLSSGMDVIAGLLYVPLSSEGKDFIAFLRRGQLRQVHWAGKPFKEGQEDGAVLEPRKSFKVRFHTSCGSNGFTEESDRCGPRLSLVGVELGQMNNLRPLVSWPLFMARFVMALLAYSRHLNTGRQFIEVWRQKESALQSTELTNLLLSNASHEGEDSQGSLTYYNSRILSSHTLESHHQVSFNFRMFRTTLTSFKAIWRWR
jgi:hypothetical protein